MLDYDQQPSESKECVRCGGLAFYWPTAIVAGDPHAPAGSRRALSHHQPAWTCLNCGHIEPHERRTRILGTTAADRRARL
ncbi:MAG: hypothetical protein AB7Q15_04145 [Vicinamibacterales bacterium]